MDTLIELKNIVLFSNEYKVLNDISLAIPADQFCVMIGPSGCGKSTLLKVAAGILIPDSGDVLIEGHDYHTLPEKQLLEVKKKNGFVFQDSALWSNKTIFENLSLPLHFHFPALSPAAIMEKIRIALAEINLLDSIYLRPAQLSTGEQKLVAVMRALITEPSVLFLDEPTTSIDLGMRKKIIAMLVKEKNKKSTIVAVTNDIDIISLLTDYLIILKEGVVVQAGTLADVKKSTHADVMEILAEVTYAVKRKPEDGVFPRTE